MMKGYDKQEALAFIDKKINRKEHQELADQITALLSQIIDADMRYMHESGVLDEEGYASDSYYEDDDAFEYMVESVVASNQLTPEQAVKVASLVDDYMDFQQEYLEYKGLVEWE